MPLPSRPATRLSTRFAGFFGGEAGAGVLLILVAALALIAANSPLADAYHHLFHGRWSWTPVAGLDSWHLWINDGLMAVFFFVVGLEIKRELLQGQLSTAPRRRLPVLAAAAGMIVPAAIYLALTAWRGGGLARGWAIPAATDIAFAVGVLALLGSRVPASLRLFLLTVAIVDDLGAVAIIAVVYAGGIDLAWLGAGAAVLLAMFILNRLAVRRAWPYLLLAPALWFCTLHSGIHATVAGVLAASTIPLGLDRRGDSLLLRLEHGLAPWSAYLIVPLFGLANAGVHLSGGFAGLLAPLPLAVAAGLFAGKQAGILGTIAFARATGFAAPPAGATWAQLWGMAALCGIGFTMSLFVSGLAFPARPDLIEAAKLGILAGSLLSAALGYAVLRLAARR